jgi:16S rRNA processing protein RimM
VSSSWDDWVTVGRVVRPQGNRGEVVVEPATDFAEERFQEGAVLHVRRHATSDVEDVQVTSSREQGGRWVVGLTGIASIDAAELLRGLELRIPAEQLKGLDAGRHYVHDLVGCRVESIAGEELGPVVDVQLDAGVPLLKVKGRTAEILVPFTDEICRRVDTAARVIVVAAPEGLVELNETRAGKAQSE